MVVRYIYRPVLNFEAENEFFVYEVEYRILLKMLATTGIERIKIFLPLYPSGVQCIVFTLVQGFEALVPHLGQVTLCLYQDSNENNQFRSTLLFLLQNFQS